MAIYRGAGGAGDATNDAASEVLLAISAREAAQAAQVAAEAAQVAAETAETNAETAETNAAASAALAATYTPSQTGNSGKYLKTNGTTTSWDAIEINTADITGTLPIANGGTNATTQADARTNLGVTATGADTTYAYRANNLSDLASASAARTNLLAVGYTATTGSAIVPSGTTAQRDGSPAAGYFRFNSSVGKFEGHNGTAWGSVGGGATGGGSDEVFVENSTTVTTNYTLTSGKNAMSVGSITINAGVTVTVPSGARWVVL